MDPHLTHDSLGPSEPTTQRASQFSSDVFAQVTVQRDAPSPTKLPLPMDVADVDPNLIIVPWAHLSPQPKRHLDHLSRFCRAH